MLVNFWKQTSLTVKTALCLTALIVFGISFFIGARTAMAASLKPVSVVTEDVITVGDLFENVRRNADYVIGAAPRPGQDMTLNARTLYRIATALDLQWRPASNSDQITIRREANIVTADIIERSLRSALKEKGVEGNYKVEFNKGEPTIVLPNTLSERADIVDLKYNPQRDYFQADVVAPSVDNPLKKISVTGQIKRMVKVPVLRSTLQYGDIIGANDINFIDIEEQTLQHDVVMNANDMIGLTPRRIAYAGKLVLQGTLGKPQLVNRGDPVNITFREGPLVLSAKGKALQSGAKGDLVRVTNTTSSRTVDAFVTGENQVAVR